MHPPTEERDHPHACYEGVVYIGHMATDESGDEVEVYEAVPCRKCLPEVEAR
jgi:hypothetical protein